MQADFHVHSVFSGDCDAPMEAQIQRALRNRLDALCFTDHLDADYPYTDVDFTLDTSKYLNALSGLQKTYEGHIRIYRGVELGLLPHLGNYYREYCEKYPFDFVIGSTHLTQGQDPYYPAFWENRASRACLEAFFKDTLENIRACGCFDVYGHLDYINRYIPSGEPEFSYSDYTDLIDECLRLLISTGKGLEVNTGGYKAGLLSPNPCPDILRRYRELGGEIITTGSDAHFAEYVGYCFDRVYGLLEECGFRYVAVFEGRKAEFVRL